MHNWTCPRFLSLTRLPLPGLQPEIFPAFATERPPVCAHLANRYNPFSYMAAFLLLITCDAKTKRPDPFSFLFFSATS